MYKVLVVDDEPTGLNHVCMILEKKCPQYEIMATAENGLEALELIQKEQPDMLIADISMPIVDGITLVEKVKVMYPDILSVIVTGYTEFEYAKRAMKANVCDYLLKPLVPSEMQNLLNDLAQEIEKLFYEKRKNILRDLCNKRNASNDVVPIERYFETGQYYAVLIRHNGLMHRYLHKGGFEIFSMEEEKIYCYGRDEMEALYLIPLKLMIQMNLKKTVEKLYEKEEKQHRGAYITEVVYDTSFSLNTLYEVAGKIYRKLEGSIIIGKNQIIWESEKIQVKGRTIQERKSLEHVEYLIRHCDKNNLLSEIKNLFAIWEQEEHTQIYIETNVKYIFRLIIDCFQIDVAFSELEFWIDDAFYYASNMKELENNIEASIRQCIPDLEKENIDNKELLFRSILSYLEKHLDEPLSLGIMCKEFGVSQTYLSRMFRSYLDTSFSNYLTEARIQRAQEIMKEGRDTYIKDVAERCGYSDQFYFSRIFRSVTGLCPREFIMKLSEQN